jgi:hypothetical protein
MLKTILHITSSINSHYGVQDIHKIAQNKIEILLYKFFRLGQNM